MASTSSAMTLLRTRLVPILSKAYRHPTHCFVCMNFARAVQTSCNVGMKYTKDHEWISDKSGVGRVGVTNYAQEKLGELVYVELPEVGREVSAGDTVGALESVKAASDLLTPVSGEITAVNEELESSPDLINKSPHKEGWIYDIKLAQPEELDSLLSEEEYDKFIKESEDS